MTQKYGDTMVWNWNEVSLDRRYGGVKKKVIMTDRFCNDDVLRRSCLNTYNVAYVPITYL